MKRKLIVIIPIIFSIVSCTNATREFEDEELRQIVNKSEAEKNELRKETHSFYIESYSGYNFVPGKETGLDNLNAGFDIKNTPVNEAREKIKEKMPNEQVYFSFDNNYLEMRFPNALRTSIGIIQKDGDTYIKSGDYFETFKDLYTDEVVKNMYERYANQYLYCFDMADALKSVVEPDGMDFPSVTKSDFDIYRDIYCMSNEGNGTFHIGIKKEFTIEVNSRLDETTTLTSRQTLVYLDYAFKDYRFDYSLIREDIDGDNSVFTALISLGQYTYNVELEDCFKLI